MKLYARLSCFNQVIEVFEESKYDIEEVYPNETIVECDNTVTLLMWYVDGQFTSDYTPHIPMYSLTLKQLEDSVLYLLGVSNEPRT